MRTAYRYDILFSLSIPNEPNLHKQQMKILSFGKIDSVVWLDLNDFELKYFIVDICEESDWRIRNRGSSQATILMSNVENSWLKRVTERAKHEMDIYRNSWDSCVRCQRERGREIKCLPWRLISDWIVPLNYHLWIQFHMSHNSYSSHKNSTTRNGKW